MSYPIVTSAAPTSGPAGTPVTLSGFNFTGTTSVAFGGTSASFTVVDDNTITTTVPTGLTAGALAIVVVNADGSSDDVSPAVDSSGNGNDGTYVPVVSAEPPIWTDGLILGDPALLANADPLAQQTAVEVPPGVADWTTPFSFAMWFSASDTFALEQVTVFGGANSLEERESVLQVWFALGLEAGDHLEITDQSGFGGSVGQSNPFDASLADGARHFVGVSFDGTNAVYVIDGTDLGEAVPYVPGGAGTPFDTAAISGGNGAQIVDEYATFRSALSASDFAALYAAGTDIATYASAVLGFSPTGYWHLNDGGQDGTFMLVASSGWHVGSLGVG